MLARRLIPITIDSSRLRQLTCQCRYDHRRINHRAGEYVRDDVHTNGIEGVWALFKRQIIGTHHWLSEKHLFRYASEMTWRFNRRDACEGERVNQLLAMSAGRLRYRELIS